MAPPPRPAPSSDLAAARAGARVRCQAASATPAPWATMSRTSPLASGGSCACRTASAASVRTSNTRIKTTASPRAAAS
eukprot:4322673-Lingulodinium_polyedra.AAC.1